MPCSRTLRNFRPEFLNRVDETIVFHALDTEHLKKIVDIQLSGLRAVSRSAASKWNSPMLPATHLVQVGYDPTFGARPLKRAIQREVETPLARKILSGEVRDGHRINGDARKGALHFETTEAVRA
jgi:ATP-dependent Clp protease ATP-binding subunit ClpB